jgi:hypothetical protein
MAEMLSFPFIATVLFKGFTLSGLGSSMQGTIVEKNSFSAVLSLRRVLLNGQVT